MLRRANNQQLSPCCCGVTRLWLSSTVQSSWLLLSLLSADVWMLFIFAWHGIHGNFLEKNNTRQHWGGFFKSKRGRVTGSPSPSSARKSLKNIEAKKKRFFTLFFTTYLLRLYFFHLLFWLNFFLLSSLFFSFFDDDFRARPRRLLPQPVTTANQVQNQRRKTKIT
jgi:hypothetical protein